MSDGILGLFGALLGGLIGFSGSLVTQKDNNETLGLRGCGWVLFGVTVGLAVGAIAGLLIAHQIDGIHREIPLTEIFSSPTSNNSFSSTLVINENKYSMPDQRGAFFCVAQNIHTEGSNQRDYFVVIPTGWVMAWNSFQASWAGGGYDSDGLVVIFGPWEGSIKINTGGSCSGPVEWLNQIIENRCIDYPVNLRPIFVVNGYTSRTSC